jgi:hypothetical protein
LCAQHPLHFCGLRAAKPKARAHHVLRCECATEISLRQRQLCLFQTEMRGRLGIDLLCGRKWNLRRAQAVAAAVRDEVGREMMADAERYIGVALQDVGEFSRGGVVGVDLLDDAAR